MKSLAGFGAEPQAGLGGSPLIPGKIDVSGQEAQPPTIETGLIRKAGIQVNMNARYVGARTLQFCFLCLIINCFKQCDRNRNSRLRLRCESCYGCFALGNDGGLAPMPLPEGFHPSDSRLRFARF